MAAFSSIEINEWQNHPLPVLLSADHTYDGPGRLWRRLRRVNFNRLIKTDATVGVTTTNYEHVYDGSKHLGSIDVTNPGTPVNGKVWKWGVGGGNSSEVMEAPQWSSASGSGYFYVNDERAMSRRTYDSNLNAGDTTEQTRYGEWLLVNGGAVGQRGTAGSRSELFSAYNTTLDADRSALPVTDHALMLAQTDLEYEVTRVKSPILGRDLNPMGRGDGSYYPDGGNLAPEGSLAVRAAKAVFLGNVTTGFGNSVNNMRCPPGYQAPPQCTQPVVKLGKCDADAPAESTNSCCNVENPEVWKIIWGGHKAYRDCVGDSLKPPWSVPPRNHPCRWIGLLWLNDCLCCDVPLDGDGLAECIEANCKNESRAPCPTYPGSDYPMPSEFEACVWNHCSEYLKEKKNPCQKALERCFHTCNIWLPNLEHWGFCRGLCNDADLWCQYLLSQGECWQFNQS